MKIYGGGEVQTHTTLFSALAGDKWSAFMTSHFTLQERTPGSLLWEKVWPPPKSHFTSPAIVMLNELFQLCLVFVLFIYELFNNAVSSSDYTALNGMISD